MINPHNILKLLSNFILEKFGYNAASTITSDEEQIARNLFNCLITILECTSYVFENESTLDIDEESTYLNAEDPNSTTPTFTQFDVAFDTDYQPTDNDIDLDQQFSLEYMKSAVDYFDEKNLLMGKRKRSWSSVQHRFRRIPNHQYLTRFRKYISTGGTKRNKINDVEMYVYDQFQSARRSLLAIHDIDLRRWALQKARELDLNNFEVSDKWLLTCKHRHRISSRKVTKLVTKKHIETRQEIEQSATNFVQETNKLIQKYNPNEILNTDQVGINLEPYGNRSLTYTGEKST